jgi:hypothetical protein
MEQLIQVWQAHKKRESAQRGNAPVLRLSPGRRWPRRVWSRRGNKACAGLCEGRAGKDGPELAGGDDDLAFVDLGLFPKTHEVRMRETVVLPVFFCGRRGGERSR